MKQEKGFTLIELMVTLTVLAIIMAFAAPSLADFLNKRKVASAAEQLYSELQYARSEAISRSAATFVDFSANGTTTWSVGVTITDGGCDPTVTTPTGTNACVLVIDDGDGTVDPGDGSVDTGDLVLRVFGSAIHPGVTMSSVSFSPGATSYIRFDPVRGTSSNGTITLSHASGYQMNVVINNIGRARLCSPAANFIPGYPQC